jgi:hypothetical protein
VVKEIEEDLNSAAVARLWYYQCVAYEMNFTLPTTSKDSRPLLSSEILVLLGKATTLARLLHIKKKMVRSSGDGTIPRFCWIFAHYFGTVANVLPV